MQRDLPRPRGAAAGFTFETTLEKEGEVLDGLLAALARNQLPPGTWSALHLAAVRDERIVELAEAYAVVAQGKRLKASPPAVVGEFLYRAGVFSADTANEPARATEYWQRAVAAFPTHPTVFGRLESALIDAGDRRAQADLYMTQAHNVPRAEQADFLRRAVLLLEQEPDTDALLVDQYQEILRLDPHDDETRGKLEVRYMEANRPKDVARLLEQALAADPPPQDHSAREIRGRLIHLYSGPLGELERSLPHVEALLADDPEHDEARAVAQKLLEVKALAGRAAAALAQATEATGTPADVIKILAVELEHTRGPKRRDVLRKIGILRQDGLGDDAGAYEAFEQALALDAGDAEVLRRYGALAIDLHKELDAGRTLGRFAAAARDPHARARLSMEVGGLYLAGGDPKRARAAFVGVLAMPDLPEDVALRVSRSLCAIYTSERDYRSLADSLDRVAQLEPNDELRQIANEELAELAQTTLRDAARAITAWRRLVNTPSRQRALDALEPLYEATGNAVDLAFVLEERSKDQPDQEVARQLAFRAAEVLTAKAPDRALASDAWARYSSRFGADRTALAAWIPLLEAAEDWTRLSSALEADASLASDEDRPALYVKLGQIRLHRTADVLGAIDAFGRALASDPSEAVSRSTLEKLAAGGPERLAAARVLEPYYREEQHTAGILRVLDLVASASPSAEERTAAILEALGLLDSADGGRRAEWVARGLHEAVVARGEVDTWIERLQEAFGERGRQRGAVALTRALGDLVVDSAPLLTLARRAAEAHAATGDAPQALALYRRALAYDSTSPDLLVHVDELLRTSGASDERVALYRTALAQEQGPRRRQELLHTIAGIERSDLRDSAAAINTLEGALGEDPTDHEAISALGELYAEAGRWDTLLSLLERSLAQASPDQARAIRARMAEVAVKQGDPTRARDLAQGVLDDGATTEPEVVVLERVARALEDAAMLRAVLARRAALASDPVEQVAWLDRLAALELSGGTPDLAVATWKRAADLAETAGEAAEARRIFERARELAPRDPEIARRLADLLERAEEWSKLPELYAVLLEHSELASVRIDVLMRHARLLAEHLDDLGSALVSAAQAFQLAAASAEYREVLSMFTMLALRGKATHIFAQAMDDAIVVNAGADVEHAARRTELRMAKARVLSANREGREAAAAAYRAILDDAGVTDVHLKAALHAFESLLSGEASDARLPDRRWLFAWRAERASGAEKAAALESWASAEESLFGDPARSLELYRSALTLAPESQRILSAVARLSLGLGDAAGAVDALTAQRDQSEGAARRAIELEIATTYLHRLARPEDALASVTRLLEDAPDDPGALALSTELLSDATTRDAMARVLEAAQGENRDPSVRSRILRALLDAGGAGAAPPDVRGRWFDALFDLQREANELEHALETALAAAHEQPDVSVAWDRAEDLARQIQRPRDVADAHRRALALPLSVEAVTALGERGVAFQEEWFEDVEGVVRILERVLEVDPQADWAFNRLKMIFDAAERWTELFALYDRTIQLVDDARKAALYEDAAQIAKDFANDSDRAVSYLERLLALRPTDGHLVASLERLYERKGAHRQLVELLTQHVGSQKGADAQRTRARIANLWLDELKEPERALAVAEEILRSATGVAQGDVDPLAIVERVMAASPRGAAGVGEPKPVRYRAAALLREPYERAGRDADLARLLEVELEIATSPEELKLGHRRIAAFYTKLGDEATALEHVAALVVLEPDVAAHRDELSALAARIGRYDRLADVLVGASERAESELLRAELMLSAGDVWVVHLHDEERAIGAYLGVLAAKAAPPALVLAAAQKVEPLLERANRAWDLLDVLERLAGLEDSVSARARAWTLAARLSASLGDNARAIAAWEARLEEEPDGEALDSLIDLLDRESRWPALVSALDRRARSVRSRDQQQADRVRIARVQQDRIGDAEAAITEWTATERDFGATDESTDALCRLLAAVGRWSDLEARLAAAASGAETSTRRAELHARLGDVVRVHGSDPERARLSYQEALRENPRESLARAGLLALARANVHRDEALAALIRAFTETDEWQETLALTPLRLDAASSDAARTLILRESAKLAEDRGDDRRQAFEFLARAFLLEPDRAEIADEFARVAGLTEQWQEYADAHERVLASLSAGDGRTVTLGDPAWRSGFRYRLGKVKDAHLSDAVGALRAFEDAAGEAPANLAIALSTIDVAARLSRWPSVAAAIVRVSLGLGSTSADALSAAERAAQDAHAWDELTTSLAAEVASATDIAALIARDIEASLGAWHRDRRGDPDAAESAFVRALAYDSSNAELLTALAQLQRRAKGRPLVDSLLRLSQATGGDLELLREGAEVAITSLADRTLARTILTSLIELAETRWNVAAAPAADDASDGPVSIGAAASPAPVVRWAISQLVQIHEDDGHPDRTVDLLTTAARLPWDPAEARDMLHQAARVARDGMGDSDRATQLYQGLFDSRPDDAAATAALVALYEAGEKHAELLRLYQRVVERSTDADERVHVRLSASRLEVKLGNPDAATKLLRDNLADAPRHGHTITALVEVLESTDRPRELADLLVAQAELAEGAGEARVAAAFWVRAAEVAELRLADPERAIRHYRRALPLEESAISLDALARLLSLRGEHAASAEMIDRLLGVAAEPARPALILRLVEALIAAGHAPRAREKLEGACASNPDDQTLTHRLVALYEEQGAWSALAELHRGAADRAADKSAKLSHLRAAAELFINRCGAPELAVPLLEQASVLDPEDRATKLVLADAFVHSQRFPEARALLRTIIDGFAGRRPKERGVAHYHLALLEIATGNRAQALVELDAATKIDPANARILRALAELARDDGQVDRAERSYRALLVALKRPEDSTEDATVVRSEVLLELSAIAAGQGQTDRARELIESALESAAKSLVEARRLERGLREKRDFVTLVRALEERLARATNDPSRVEVLTELARVLDVELGHLASAFTARQNVLALTPAAPGAHEASLALARRVDGVARYLDDVERLAESEERHGRRESASALYLRLGQTLDGEIKDDARAVVAYERSLAAVTGVGSSEQEPASGASRAPSDSRQALIAVRALDPIYERLGKREARAKLLAKRVELESEADDPRAAADARYRLAELLFATGDGALEGGLHVTQALALDKDLVRAEQVARDGVRRHPNDEGLLDLLESIGRNAGHERALLDALELRLALPGASQDAAREAAMIATQLGDAPRAEALLTRLVAGGDDESVAWALEELATLREAAGDTAGAIAWKRRAADVTVPGEARRLRFEMARLTEGALGDAAGAAALYEALFDEDPSDVAASEPMLAAFRKAGDAESLVRLLPRVVELATAEEERSRLRLERVRLMVDPLGRREDAIAPLTDLVADDPNHVEAASLLADLLEASGRTEDLCDLLGRQIDAAKDRQDVKQVEALSLRRAALFAKDDPDEARATLYSALDWTPESRAVLEQLVALLHEPGMEGERLDVQERLLPLLAPREAGAAATELAELRLAEGNAEAAERALELGYRADPTNRVLHDRLEALFRAANAPDKLASLCVLEAAGLTDPTARVARLREAADLFAKVPDAGRVASTLAEAFSLARTDVGLATALAAAQVRAADVPGAVETLSEALAVTPDDAARRANLLLERAKLRVDLGDDDGAAADLVAVARLGVIDVARSLDAELERVRARAEARGDTTVERTMRLELAAARAEAADLEGARPLVTELLRREPKDREALRLLAQIEERAERWDAATVAYRRLIPLEEGDLAVDTALRLADACERAGRLADARGALERTRTAAPNDEALRLRLVRLYESIGAFRELAEISLADARAAADDETRRTHLKRAGSLLLQDGSDTEAAIDALVDAHALSTDDIECTLLLADAYTVAGRTEDAQALIASQVAARAGRRSPELASLYHRLARVAHVMGDREGELGALTSGLEADAQNGFVAAELAALALEIGDIDVATRALRTITLLKDASTSHISKGVAFQYLGEIARQQGDSKRAMLLLKRALEDDPTLDAARTLIEELRAEGL